MPPPHRPSRASGASGASGASDAGSSSEGKGRGARVPVLVMDEIMDRAAGKLPQSEVGKFVGQVK